MEAEESSTAYNKEIAVLPYENIPFMHWGIVTKYNFSEDKIGYLPRKRWDPLTSVKIRLYDKVSRTLVPINKRRGHFSYISPIRARRPIVEKPSRKGKELDVFRPILKGNDYAIFISLDEKMSESPFSLRPIMMNVEKHKAVTIINRFPAMIRHIDHDVLERIRGEIEKDPFTKLAFGINLISFPSEYSESLSDVSFDSLSALFKSMNAAIRYSISEAVKRGINLVPVYPFFNIGPLAGGSQPRLHIQVYIDLNQDGHGALMENLLQSFEEQKEAGICHLCTTRHNGRIAYENTTWIVWATSSPRRNFHLRLSTKRHVERIVDLDDAEIRGLADALIVISRALDRLGVSGDRNILVYSNPFGYSSYFHIFIDIIPFERIGGIEMLDSCRVARHSPEIIAEELGNIIKKENITSA